MARSEGSNPGPVEVGPHILPVHRQAVEELAGFGERSQGVDTDLRNNHPFGLPGVGVPFVLPFHGSRIPAAGNAPDGIFL